MDEQNQRNGLPEYEDLPTQRMTEEPVDQTVRFSPSLQPATPDVPFSVEADAFYPAADLVDWEQEQWQDEMDDEAFFAALAAEQAQSDLFTDPYQAPSIETDENSIAYHGMSRPGDPEPDYHAYLYDEPTTVLPAEKPQNSLADEELTALLAEEPTQEEPAVPKTKNRPVKKGRPKRKKGDGLFGLPHLISTAIWLFLILAIGVTLGRMVWVCAADVLAFGRPDREVIVTIDSDDTIDTIADKLHQAGLVRYPGLFRLYADLAVDDGEISTGTFTLNTLYDYHALVGGMSSGSSYRAVISDVLIPEGYSCRQIFELLEEKGICTVKELEEYAANGEFSDFWFLKDVQRGDKYCLEGYLFPDTYDFYEKSTPREALGKMLTGFDTRINEDMAAKLDTLNNRLASVMRENGKSETYISEHLLTFHDVVIIASMIEKETANNKESYNIASVIYNRLYDWGSTPAYLNIDAAIIYANGGDTSNIDTSLDSPYNTYLNTGLTPGPIANPGLASLEAALSPADTNYYFYVLNPETGVHTFSKTREEHEKLVEQYRNYQGD